MSGSPRERAGLCSASELGTSEGVISEPLLKTDGVVRGASVLVSASGTVAKEAVVSRTSEEVSGVEMLSPLVLVLAVLPDVPRRGGVPGVRVETGEVGVAVEVVFRAVASSLSVHSVVSPVNGGMDTWFRQNNSHLLDWQ